MTDKNILENTNEALLNTLKLQPVHHLLVIEITFTITIKIKI
jgi:hypothetical protein